VPVIRGGKTVKILMIEDDKTTVEVIRLTMEVNAPGSTIKSTDKGRDGLESARQESFDVVVLDLGLPDIDGIRVLEELRQFSQTPVLIVSARHDPQIITNALDMGAQDYILKPFKFQTFLNSLNYVSPRTPPLACLDIPGEINGEVTICCKTREALINGQQVMLTENEWKILRYLIEHSGRIVPVKQLAACLSEEGFRGESAVHLVINQIRRKIGDDPYCPKIIISEFECGYRFIKSNAVDKFIL
jgi:two-component system KDP operon response regulator KdpE